MSEKKQKTALIIGGGVAGLNAALYLDELGYHVTLLEAKPVLGGRTYAFEHKKTSQMIDNGQHLLIGAYHETIRFLEKVGAKHKIAYHIPTKVPLQFDNGQKVIFHLNTLPPPLNLLRALFKLNGFSIGEKLGFFKLGLEVQKILKEKKQPPHHLTVYEWLKSLGQSDKVIRNFWEVLTLATLNETTQVACASLLYTVLAKSFFGEKRDGFLVFPKTNLTQLFVEPASEYLNLRGHHLRSKTKVKEIKILNHQVQGVQTADGEILKADLYVSAIPFQRLRLILPKAFLENSEWQAVREMQCSPIVSINLFYDQKVLTEDFVGSAATPTHWFFNHNAITGEKNTYHHVIGVMSAGYEFLEKSKDEIVAQATRDLAVVCPQVKNVELKASQVNIERQATLSCTVKNNALRPKQEVFENFYIIGDWTQTGLPATIESAAVSAKLMAESIAKRAKMTLY